MSRSSHAVVRWIAVALVVAALAGSALAAPRERGPREKVRPIGQFLKNIVRALGDGLTIPKP